MELKPIRGDKMKVFMTPEQYRDFWEKFQRQVAPDLEKQRIARLRSAHAARFHLVD